MTSRGNRNPAKLDPGAGTRRWRRRISTACPPAGHPPTQQCLREQIQPATASHNATVPLAGAADRHPASADGAEPGGQADPAGRRARGNGPASPPGLLVEPARHRAILPNLGGVHETRDGSQFLSCCEWLPEYAGRPRLAAGVLTIPYGVWLSAESTPYGCTHMAVPIRPFSQRLWSSRGSSLLSRGTPYRSRSVVRCSAFR